MTNRNPVKQLFITFPKSNVDKVEFRDALLRFEPSYYKVCEEKHKDGTPHLHAVVKFKNKYSKAYVLKYFKEIYPTDYKRIDVKPVRSIKNAIAYLSKEDESPLESGPFQDSRNPQRNSLNKFVHELGFSDIADCAEYCNMRNEMLQSMCSLSHKYLEELDFIGGPETSQDFLQSLKFAEKESYDKFRNYSIKRIQKDDITFFNKVLNLKYQ